MKRKLRRGEKSSHNVSTVSRSQVYVNIQASQLEVEESVASLFQQTWPYFKRVQYTGVESTRLGPHWRRRSTRKKVVPLSLRLEMSKLSTRTARRTFFFQPTPNTLAAHPR